MTGWEIIIACVVCYLAGALSVYAVGCVVDQLEHRK